MISLYDVRCFLTSVTTDILSCVCTVLLIIKGVVVCLMPNNSSTDTSAELDMICSV